MYVSQKKKKSNVPVPLSFKEIFPPAARAQETKNCGDKIILESTVIVQEPYGCFKAQLHANGEIQKSDWGAIIKQTKYSKLQGDYSASITESTLATSPTLSRFSSLSLELVSWGEKTSVMVTTKQTRKAKFLRLLRTG